MVERPATAHGPDRASGDAEACSGLCRSEKGDIRIVVHKYSGICQ